MKKILIFTAAFDAENGQAVVTRRVVTRVLPETAAITACIYTPGGHPRSILSWIAASGRFFYHLLFSDIEAIYLVCSRTMPGFARDIPALLAVLLGKRVIVHCHGSDFLKMMTGAPHSALARFFYRRCEVIFPCQYLDSRSRQVVKQAHVCENFCGEFTAYSAGPDDQSPALTVLWNSNIMATKGFFDVTEAVYSLAHSGRRIRLICFGKVLGDEEMSAAEVQKGLVKCKDQPWFSYLGLVAHSKAIAMLQNCDVVALPSRYRPEMQPLAIIEAMCAGKSIILSDTPSLRVTAGDYPADFVRADGTTTVADFLENLCQQKEANPEQFETRNRLDAERARIRFSVARFDADIRNILGVASKHGVGKVVN